jgi:hypothetical protein
MQHPALRTKPQRALELVAAARATGIPFRAVVAASRYGAHPVFTRTLWQAEIPWVLAVLAVAARLDTAARAGFPLGGGRPPALGERERRRASRGPDGRYGPERSSRLVVATSHPRTRPTASPGSSSPPCRCPAPGGRPSPRAPGRGPEGRGAARRAAPGGGARVEAGPAGAGGADFQVRSDRAIRRQWALACCAVRSCWWAESQRHARDGAEAAARRAVEATRSLALPYEAGAGEQGDALAAKGLPQGPPLPRPRTDCGRHPIRRRAPTRRRAKCGAGLIPLLSCSARSLLAEPSSRRIGHDQDAPSHSHGGLHRPVVCPVPVALCACAPRASRSPRCISVCSHKRGTHHCRGWARPCTPPPRRCSISWLTPRGR